MMTDRVNLTKARATNERNGYRGDRMKNIPHLFAKATIIYCIAFASVTWNTLLSVAASATIIK